MNTTNDVYVISLDAVDLNLLPISQTHRDGGAVPLWRKSNLDSRRKEYYEFVIKSDDAKGQNEPVIENVTCHICDMNVPKVYLNEHKNGFRHKFNRKVADTALKRLQLYVNKEDINEFDEKLPFKHFCTECSIVIDSEDETSHKQTTGHRNALFLERFLNEFLNFYTNDDNEIRKDDTRKDIKTEVIKESKNSEHDFVSDESNTTKTVLANITKDSIETEVVKETKDDENSKTILNSDERNVNSSPSCDLQKDEVIFQVADGSKMNNFKITRSYYEPIVEMGATSGYCMICNHMYVQESLSLHARSDIHNQNSHRKPLDKNCVRKVNSTHHHCALCDDYFTEYDLHVNSKEHLTNFRNKVIGVRVIHECDKTVQENDNSNKDKKDDNSTKYSDVINSDENKSSTGANKNTAPVNKETSDSLVPSTKCDKTVQDNDNCNKDKKDDNTRKYSDIINSDENKSSTGANKTTAPVNKETSDSLVPSTKCDKTVQDNDNYNKDKKDDNTRKYSNIINSDENKSSTGANKTTAPVNKETSDSLVPSTKCDKTVQDNDNCNKDKKDDNTRKYSDIINSDENKSSTGANKTTAPVNKETSDSLVPSTKCDKTVQDNDNCNKDKKDDNTRTYSDIINSDENKSSTGANKTTAPVNKETSDSLVPSTKCDKTVQDNDNCNKDKKDDNTRKYSDIINSDENKSSTGANKTTAPVNKETRDSLVPSTKCDKTVQDNDNCNKDKKDDNTRKYSDIINSDENKSSTGANKTTAPVNNETSDSLATNASLSVPINPTLFCNICNVWISPNQFNEHKNTIKHNLNEKSNYHYLMKCLDEEKLFCRICSVNVSNVKNDITKHFTSVHHVKTYNNLLKDHGITKRYYRKYYCRECKVYMLHKNEYLHIISKEHANKVGFSKTGEIDKQCDAITRTANGDANVALVNSNTGGGGSVISGIVNATNNVRVNANNETALKTVKQLDKNLVNINPDLREILFNLSKACAEWLTNVKENRESNKHPTENGITAVDNENTVENRYICDVCKVEVPNNDNNIAEHNRGRSHRLKLGTYVP